jgi:tetraacyldisaccharide 4'-kinase
VSHSRYDWLQRVWYSGERSGALLIPLAVLFGAAVAARSGLYRLGVLRAERVGRPVVIVGNLTAGGVGKTPLVLWLAAQLRGENRRVGIVTRGYGAAQTEARRVQASSSAADVGDEALLLARRSGCPVAVGADRAAAARLLAGEVDVILADDGLQHRRLARDMEIVVVDGERGFGNGRLLPAGPLREPVARLASVDIVVCNGGVPAAGQLHFTLVAAEAVSLASGARRPLASFAGRAVHAIAAIGNPGRFFSLLRSHGLQPIEHPFPDHDSLQHVDLAFPDGLPVLVTEKDSVKIPPAHAAGLWVVPVELRWSGNDGQRLLGRLRDKIRAHS